MRRILAGVVLLLAGCAAPPELPPVPRYEASVLQQTRYRAVLVAGDASIPVFDNATDRLAAGLAARGARVVYARNSAIVANATVKYVLGVDDVDLLTDADLAFDDALAAESEGRGVGSWFP